MLRFFEDATRVAVTALPQHSLNIEMDVNSFSGKPCSEASVHPIHCQGRILDIIIN